MSGFRTIQGSAVHVDICPYIAIVVNDAHATVNSIYRGQDAAAILHKHGKSTQAELYQLFLQGRGNPANSPGHSTHELRSDAAAYPGVPYGQPLPWWCQGFDVNDSDVYRVIAAGRRYGWRIWQPYPSSSEFHHLNFAVQPHPTPRTRARILRIRAFYPRS